MIYLSTAIGLTPGGSTVHSYTQTIRRTTQWQQNNTNNNYFVAFTLAATFYCYASNDISHICPSKHTSRNRYRNIYFTKISTPIS